MADFNPWKSDMAVGRNDMDTVVLSSPGGEHYCEIYTHGATVTSWKYNGLEKIFCSTKAIFNGVKAIRGGIPLVFPQFGQPDKNMAQHGFARNSTWDVNCLYTSETSATVVFSMKESVETLALWPFKFELNYFVTLSAENLTCELKMCNTGGISFSCQGLLHTYLSVADINSISVHGLEGARFVDKVTGGLCVETETRQVVPINQETDRVYSGAVIGISAPDVLVKSDDVALMEVSKSACLEDLSDAAPSACDPASDTPVDFSTQPTTEALSAADAAANTTENAASNAQAVPTDVVVWNLWAEKAAAMADMADTEYHSFLCVEPGCVSGMVDVIPGKRLALKQVLTPK